MRAARSTISAPNRFFDRSSAASAISLRASPAAAAG
jgi:hypothetical protein